MRKRGCPCLTWAYDPLAHGEWNFSAEHHPACDGTGNHRAFVWVPTRLPWDQWYAEFRRVLRERVAKAAGAPAGEWDWTQTMDAAAARASYYDDEYYTPDDAADEELYALSNC